MRYTIQVHPHVRGENDSRAGWGCFSHGTPPRAWGKPNNVTTFAAFFRYTPTCVGKTSGNRRTDISRCGTPPRAWGKRTQLSASGMSREGTPPRAWGKQPALIVWLSDCRYTPTCVGKTNPSYEEAYTEKVHPHVRGENLFSAPHF